MIKKGDKLLCKKTMFRRDRYIILKEGDFYEVVDITNNNNIIHFKEFIDIKKKSNLKLYLSSNDLTPYKIYEWFYNEKEIRKLKLEKIKDRNEKN